MDTEHMKKILVLVADYPNNDGGVALMYVHTRNKYYVQHEIDVTVLNFASDKEYDIDGINVITKESYDSNPGKYDVLVLHAANIRNHYRFLIRYEKRFAHIIFFFHGHEVLKLNESYPRPYEYVKTSGVLRRMFQDCYDVFKLSIWRRYLPKVAKKTDFVFVSNWFHSEFKRYTRLDNENLQNHVHIINNSVGSVFEENSYHFAGKKKYDFITIRSNMDASKYCIDLVDGLARKYPQYSFLVIGRGDYFKVHNIPNNITWVDKFLSHKEIMEYIDQSRCGLLLTREDTQGVMTCELSTYGIPVITSNIDVCKEICGDLKNVELVDNDLEKINLSKAYEKLLRSVYVPKPYKFSYANTVKNEEALILNREEV